MDNSAIKEIVDELANEIALANEAYLSGNPIISDYQYDVLVEKMRALVIEENIAEPEILKQVVGHSVGGELLEYDKWLKEFPMRSIKPAFKEEDLKRWSAWLDTYLRGNPTDLVISLKADGYSFRAVYVNGVLTKATTRGRDGAKGLDITRHLGLLVPNNIVLGGTVEIRGELVLPMDSFNILQDRYKVKSFNNPRNSVAALIKEDAVDEDIKLLMPLAYALYSDSNLTLEESINTLKINGFKTLPYMMIEVNNSDEHTTFDLVMACVDILGKIKETVGYLSDGLVVSPNNLNMVYDVGGDEKYLTAVLAIKVGAWKSKIYRAKIVDIELSYGTKYISPIAIIEPLITDSGREVERISLTNVDIMMKARAYIGNYIDFEYVSDMIPHILIYGGNTEEN